MNLRHFAALATAGSLAAAASLFAQTPAAITKPITKTKSVSGSATIQAIDAANRMVTLRTEKGEEDTFAVSTDVQRFNELKVGDVVKMTYYESIVLTSRKPGSPAPTQADTDAALTRAKGALPAATLSVQDKTTVTIKAIDLALPSVTVTTPDGRTVTRKIEDKSILQGLKVGDMMDITYTRALLTKVERAK